MKHYFVGYSLAFAGLLVSTSIQADDTKCPCQGKPPRTVLVTSIPFGGKSLAEYVVSEINNQKWVSSSKVDAATVPASLLDEAKRKKNFISCNAYPTQELVELLEKENVPVVYVVRDPQVQISEMADWLLNESFKGLSLEQLIVELIELQNPLETLYSTKKDATVLEEVREAKELTELYNNWTKYSNVYVASYEKLAGEVSLEDQILEVSKIATHIGRPISMEKAAQISKKIAEKSAQEKNKDINEKE